jgi:transcription antitermination factor NusG
VQRLVAGSENPVTVPRQVIDALLARQGEDGCVRLEPQRALKSGDAVRVIEGVFEKSLGLFECATGRWCSLTFSAARCGR